MKEDSQFYASQHADPVPYVKRMLSSFGTGQAISSGILYVQIDNMSTIISSHGAKFASTVLEKVCKSLKEQAIDAHDIAIQVDKDHLNVIIQHCDEMKLETKANEIYNFLLSFGNISGGTPIQLSATIGGAIFTSIDIEPNDVINQAYIAMNHAVESRNNYMLFNNSQMHKIIASKHQMVLANCIQNAFRENKLALAFQPIIDSKTEKAGFYECLLRIIDEDGDPVTVGPFIPVAEKMGFVDLIDSATLTMAIDELIKYPDITLSINASHYTLQNLKWMQTITNRLKEHDIANRLIVEITETSTNLNPEKLEQNVRIIKDLGCKIALDDFGTGYTSFAQIRTLPLDIVKIDGSYVRDIQTNADSRAFVETLVQLGKQLKLEVVAEFAENKEIVDILKSMEIDYIQGYYYAAASIDRPWEN